MLFPPQRLGSSSADQDASRGNGSGRHVVICVVFPDGTSWMCPYAQSGASTHTWLPARLQHGTYFCSRLGLPVWRRGLCSAPHHLTSGICMMPLHHILTSTACIFCLFSSLCYLVGKKDVTMPQVTLSKLIASQRLQGERVTFIFAFQACRLTWN